MMDLATICVNQFDVVSSLYETPQQLERFVTIRVYTMKSYDLLA